MPRKPWEIPVQYNDDRWPEPSNAPDRSAAASPQGRDDDADYHDERDIEELLSRPAREPNDNDYECNDTTPVNYANGPHDRDFEDDDE